PPPQLFAAGYGLANPAHSPHRSVGFSPLAPHGLDLNVTPTGRRGSAASTNSTLTSARPPAVSTNASYSNPSLPSYLPPNFSPNRRRSSLTPSLPTLAVPSSTRTHATGVVSRPTSSEGSPALHARHRTAPEGGYRIGPNGSPRSNFSGESGRRGSLPHLHYGGWTGPHKSWNPSLPPQRGSVDVVDDHPTLDEGFTFGRPSAVETSPSMYSRRPSTLSPRKRADMDAFALAEADEAERQRRAFMDATYGADGIKARQRLSIGGPAPGSTGGSPGTPGNMARRQSLMLWEKMGMTPSTSRTAATLGEDAPHSAPVLANPSGEDLGYRRGSLPMAIPGGGVGRRASRLEPREAPPVPMGDDTDEEVGDDEDDDDLFGRNLERSEPMPHPLPPSLHPPAPVDLAEFDIDFILAGSQAQLGKRKGKKNAPIDTTRAIDGVPATPTLRLGGDEEDSFAKFVGEFDDEYDDRRGEWTFRACNPPPSTAHAAGSNVIFPSQSRPTQDPLEKASPKAEWESQGAGKYELFHTGEVRSIQTNRTWRVRKLSSREYELEQLTAWDSQQSATKLSPSDALVDREAPSYILAGKGAHSEQGGVKLSDSKQQPRKLSSGFIAKTVAARARASASEPTAPRTGGQDSEDLGAAGQGGMAFSKSLPVSHYLKETSPAPSPRKKRFSSKTSLAPDDERTRSGSSAGVSFAVISEKAKKKEKKAAETDSDEKGEKSKKDRSIGGVIKRGWLASIKSSNLVTNYEERKERKDEKERERMQSHSWSGAATEHPTWSNARLASTSLPKPAGPHRSVSGGSQPALVGDKFSPRQTPASPTDRSEDDAVWGSLGLGIEDEQNGGLPWKEGKAWSGVPEDAVAMIVPIDSENPKTTLDESATYERPYNNAFFIDGPRQALLVWFVPFNADQDVGRSTPSTSTLSRSEGNSHSTSSSSTSKFPKLLRRRASKDRELALRKEQARQQEKLESVFQSSTPHYLQPLPFRSFRVVARVVEVEDLRSEPEVPVLAFDQWQKQNATGRAASASSSNPSPVKRQLSLPGSEEVDGSSNSTAPTSSIMAGRTFPTVIAVCHSRSQGVEFVAEGLDRLGLCEGESAWGPTGYEEWRGSGLSGKGRELLDLIWAGCTGVMGLCSP
ncbi:hypothetical protein P7C73_g6214, partial [Tremellales sp. Uapishka_1]